MRISACVAVAMALVACNGKGAGDASAVRADSVRTAGERTLSNPVAYWDKVDFMSPSILADTALIEQRFADFAAMLERADPGIRDYAVKRLLDRAAASESSYSRILEIAAHYLFDPASPMYSEEDYVPFLEYRLAHSGLGREPENVEALEYNLGMARKNAPGSQAADFSFETPSGEMRSLSQPDSKAEILLIFYGPDCELCTVAMSRLERDGNIAGAVARGELRVVMIYPGDDRQAWLRHAAGLPVGWEVGIDASRRIDGEELYWVRATPSAYLLSPSLTVLGKNVAI